MGSLLRSFKKRKKSRRLDEVELVKRREYGELELDTTDASCGRRSAETRTRRSGGSVSKVRCIFLAALVTASPATRTVSSRSGLTGRAVSGATRRARRAALGDIVELSFDTAYLNARYGYVRPMQAATSHSR